MVTRKKATKTTRKPAKPVILKTHAVIVQDDSASMDVIAGPARDGFNQSLRDIQVEA